MTRSPAQPLAELYARLARALQGRRWYVFGARAAIHYGSVRGTVDIDIGLALDGEAPDRLIENLAPYGFDLRIADWRELLDEARVLLLVDRESGIEIDVVLTGPGLEDEFHARSRRVQFGAVELPVISPEDLLIGKLLAGRPQDAQDVEAVVAAQPELDTDRVIRALGLIEQALGRADLVSAFQRVLTSLREN